jgi:hypothetical protein
MAKWLVANAPEFLKLHFEKFKIFRRSQIFNFLGPCLTAVS